MCVYVTYVGLGVWVYEVWVLCKCVWWVWELAVGKRVPIHFCQCEYPISLLILCRSYVRL